MLYFNKQCEDNFINKKKTIVILCVIFLVQAVQLFIWLARDDTPPAWDQSWHAMISANIYNQLFHKTALSTEKLESIYPIFRYANNYYPHFYHLVSVPFYTVFGASYDVALLTNLFFLAVLLSSLYYIGNHFYGPRAGLFAAFVSSTVPIYSYYMREYLLDFALAAMVALGLASLISTKKFLRLPQAIASSVVIGLGILTKGTYIFFLIVPILYTIFEKTGEPDKKRVRLRNIVIFFIVAAAVSFTWYNQGRLNIIMSNFLSVVHGSMGIILKDTPSVFSSEALFFYLFAMINDLSLFYFIVSLGAALILVANMKHEKRWLPYLLTIVAIYIFFSTTPTKDHRYIISLYTFSTILLTMGVFNLKDNRIRYCFVSVIVTLGLLQNILYNNPGTTSYRDAGRMRLYDFRGKAMGRTKVDIDAMLKEISDSAEKSHFSACIVAETDYLNDVNIPYYTIRGGYQVIYMVGNGCNPLQYDYTIVGPIDKTWRTDLFERSLATLNSNIARFRSIYTYNDISVYQLMK